MTMVMASMLPGPCRIRDFSCAHCQQFCKVPSSCSASQWGCHLKDISLSFFPPLVLFRPLCSLHQLRVAVPMRAQPASVSVFPVHRSRHKMDILHSKARWSDWTRSVCLKRRNPIYVCNEVYSLRTRTMCSWQNAEDRWLVGQVLSVPPRTGCPLHLSVH